MLIAVFTTACHVYLPIPSQNNPVETFPFSDCNSHFIIILSSMLGSS